MNRRTLARRCALVIPLACAALSGCSKEATHPQRTAADEPLTISVPSWVDGATWHLMPEAISPDVDELDEDGTRRMIREGLRLIDSPDGGLRLSPQAFPTGEVVPMQLPERLGGGFLFRGEISGEAPIWRAKTWIDDAEPLLTVGARVERLVPGFDRLYIQLAHTHELYAFDLESKTQTDLGPLPQSNSYSALAFVDAWFGAVVTDVLGLQVSFDAGDSWHVVDLGSSAAQDSGIQLEAMSDHIVIHQRPEPLRLDRDGSLTPLVETRLLRELEAHNDERLGLPPNTQLEEPAPRPGVLQPLGPRPLKEAVLYGWPISQDSAVVATRGNLGRVSLTDGRLLEVNTDAYGGSTPCRALRLGAGVGFVCSEPGLGSRVYRLVPPLSLSLLASYSTERHISSSGNGHLVVRGSCESETAASTTGDSRLYCLLDGKGGSREIRVRGELGAERVVALSDGRAVVLIPPRLGSDGLLNVITDDVSSHQLRLPKTSKELQQLLERGLWLDGVEQLDENTLGSWVAGASSYVGVTIDLNGKVRVPKLAVEERGDLGRTVLSGRFAFEVSASGVGWQTHDYGFHWTHVELPRVLDPITPDRLSRKHEDAPIIGCSAVGCSYEPWLRIGHGSGRASKTAPDDEQPKAQARAETAETHQEAEFPKRIQLNPAGYPDWHFNCYPTGDEQHVSGNLARTLEREAAARPRSSSRVGYASLLPQSPSETDIESGAYRPFWGLAGPRRSGHQLLLDVGMEAPIDFRAYAWGDRGEAWSATSGWLVRVATRFGNGPIWATAPTKAPWVDWIRAAQLFGADRANRYSTEWFLRLDADETSGALWVANRGEIELHLLEANQAIKSFGGLDLGKPVGVAQVLQTLYVAVRDGTRLSLYAAREGQLKALQRYSAGQGSHVTIVRTSDGQRIGILLHAPRGDWYIYPLDEELAPEPPIKLSRDLLNQRPTACGDEVGGWLIRSNLPLTRVGQGASLDVLALSDPYERWRVDHVAAKVIANEGSLCVASLAAELRSAREPKTRAAQNAIPANATVPLTVTDGTSRQLGFRCGP